MLDSLTRDLRGTLLTKWRRLDWRHHGTGMLQAYLPDPREGTAERVHIWDRRLLLPGLVQSGAMHNHRFRLRSRVLVGSLTNTDLLIVPYAHGTHQVWTIPGASKGSALIPGDRCALMECREACQQLAGKEYTIEKWAYHWARQEDHDTELTITHVTLEDKSEDQAASLVCPFGIEPVHAFAKPLDQALLTSIITTAYKLLQVA